MLCWMRSATAPCVAKPHGCGDDCMDAGGRAMPGAIAECEKCRSKYLSMQVVNRVKRIVRDRCAARCLILQN